MVTPAFAILIADDNELNRWLLQEQLLQWTTDITAAKDGQEAWQLLQAKQYDLIFLDMNMPFLNGIELIERVRTGETPNRATPAIAVTAHAQERQHIALIAAGFDECLIKPVLLKHLKPIIEQCLAVTSRGNFEYYAAQLVKKTESNRELSLRLLDRLLAEVPAQLLCTELAIQHADLDKAWQLSHQLHGTFCFYGFADFLPAATSLEQCLLDNDISAASLQLQSIRERFSALSDNRAAISAAVASDATKDL